MKQYKVLSAMVVFSIKETDYIGKKGEVLELPEDHITTQALVERKQIEEVKAAEEKPAPARKNKPAPAPEEETSVEPPKN